MFTAPAFSDLVIDRFLAGELIGAELAAFEARVAAEPALRARVDALRASRAAFPLSAPSFAAVAAAAAREAPWWQRWAADARARVAVAGAVAAAAVVVVTVGRVDEVDEVDGTRTKGARFVDFVVERDGQVINGAPGLTLHPGDRVQFVVDAGAGSFVGVWSKDGAGVVSAYAPASGGLVRAAGAHRFANSTRLDDVVGPEVFVGVRCATKVDEAVIAAAVAADAEARAVPAGCDLDRVVVRKAARP